MFTRRPWVIVCAGRRLGVPADEAGRIRGGFRDLAGGRIFLVAVERGGEPAFLRHGEDEEFYVRVGPSSRRLPASRVLDYSRERRR